MSHGSKFYVPFESHVNICFIRHVEGSGIVPEVKYRLPIVFHSIKSRYNLDVTSRLYQSLWYTTVISITFINYTVFNSE